LGLRIADLKARSQESESRIQEENNRDDLLSTAFRPLSSDF